MLARSVLKPDELLLSMVSFPLLGVGDFTGEGLPVNGPVSKSRFIPDKVINPHPRFATLTNNIRSRRGSKVCCYVPIFKDSDTKVGVEPAVEATECTGCDIIPPEVYMESISFGMGCCCLQVTFQSADLNESRYLHDQLSVISPIMMALTAGAPIFKGFLVDTDARWRVIRDVCDDRTPEERAADSPAKSRYDSIDRYISCRDTLKPEYNDIPLAKHEESYNSLLEAGVDTVLVS